MSDEWDGNERRKNWDTLQSAKSEVALLRGEVTVLSSQAKRLASKDEVHTLEDRFKRRFAYVILPILAILIIGIINLKTIQHVDDATRETKANTAATKALSAKIEDCLNPEGECGKKAQENQDKAIKQIVDEIVTALNKP